MIAVSRFNDHCKTVVANQHYCGICLLNAITYVAPYIVLTLTATVCECVCVGVYVFPLYLLVILYIF